MFRKKKKIAFIGNSRTHKSACFFRTLEVLKNEGLKVGYVTDLSIQAPDHAFWGPTALTFRQLAEEFTQEARTDIDYIVTERTAMEWATIAGLKSGRDDTEFEMVADSCFEYYDFLILLSSDGLVFQDDGCRPKITADFHEMEPVYQDIFKKVADQKFLHSALITGKTGADRAAATEIAVRDWLDKTGRVTR